MVNFPASLDSLANPTATTNRDDPGFALHTVISTLNDIAEALEAKLGIGATTPDAQFKSLVASAAGTSAWGYSTPVKLVEITPLGVAAATLNLPSIPGTFRALKLQAQLRGTNAATSVSVLLRFNNDTANNYDYEVQAASAASVTSAEALAASSISLGSMTGSTAGATLAAQIDVDIANYAAATFSKELSARTVLKIGTSSGNLTNYSIGGHWRSAAAITRIELIPTSGNFEVGSTVALWGWP